MIYRSGLGGNCNLLCGRCTIMVLRHLIGPQRPRQGQQKGKVHHEDTT